MCACVCLLVYTHTHLLRSDVCVCVCACASPCMCWYGHRSVHQGQRCGVCVCICILTCTQECPWRSEMYVCIHVHMCVCVCVCMCTCMYVCWLVCTHDVSTEVRENWDFRTATPCWVSTELEIKPRLWSGQVPPHQLDSRPARPFLTKQQNKQATFLVLGIFVVAWREVEQTIKK